MRQHNCEDLKLAMNKELKDQIANGNFIVLYRNKLPVGTQVLPMV